MTDLVLEPTSTAQWQALVAEAAQRCDCRLDEDLESYLVFLLMRFIKRPDLAGRRMAMEYLHSLRVTGQLQLDQLRDVGDQCLLFSGFYPRLAERRLVRVAYFVDLGRSAYGLAAERIRHAGSDLYAALASGFVGLMDVLQAMRALPGEPALDALAAMELWQDTGSRAARRQLERLTGATPLPPDRGRH